MRPSPNLEDTPGIPGIGLATSFPTQSVGNEVRRFRPQGDAMPHIMFANNLKMNWFVVALSRFAALARCRLGRADYKQSISIAPNMIL
uniref:Uncharacterized protein n=1 Tax=Tolypothrix bouteillei VB521301 TaxID=1479485 RepID=A0A0C1RNS2_9CYAN